MNTVAEFRSNRFPPYDGEEERINPGLWGKRFAEYLVARLPAQGVSAAEPIAEDWGWYVPVELDGVKLGLCCGHQYGDEETFTCFTDPQVPVRRRFFRTVDVTAPLTRLIGAVNAILSADPDIRELAWRAP